MTKLLNWAGNFQYSTNQIYYPETLQAVQSLVKKLPKVKVLGTRHSFNDIADSKESFVSLQNFIPPIEIDKKMLTVTIGAGVRYGELAAHLHKNGFALHNLGSLPHISVAGACVSATHGSGVKNGILAKAVRALEIVTANGEVAYLAREKYNRKFYGAVVNLGALGVVTRLTLDIQPSYYIKQEVFENLPLAELPYALDFILSCAYSVSLFTDWKTDNLNQVWVKSRLIEGPHYHAQALSPNFFGATPATKDLHPIITMPAENCTPQMGLHGPWHERLPHFRMDFTPSNGEELQSEYFVPREHAFEAIMAINKLRDHIAPWLLISELRTIDADQFWMSPCYKQACLAIHFTWKQNWDEVRKILPLIEKKLEKFQVRPHWAKLFTIKPSRFRALYRKLPDFQKLVQSFDPEGKFTNEFLQKNILS